MTELRFVICPNVAAIGTFQFDPATAPYTEYTQENCPRCHERMWLGARSRAEVEAGRAQMICVLCAILSGLYREGNRSKSSRIGTPNHFSERQ
jgi:hypothetical protein